jgi:hypothetical protein
MTLVPTLSHTWSYNVRRETETLHIQFQEGKLTNKTPYNLIVDIENCIRILQHAGEWETTATSDINPMAFLSAPSPDVSASMKAYLGQQLCQYLQTLMLSRRNPAPHADGRTPPSRPRPQGRFYKEWMFIPPKFPNQQLVYNDSTFFWCKKCNNGAGQWVTSHQTSTHVDGFRHPRARISTNPSFPGQPQPSPRLPPRQGYPDAGHPPAFQRAPRPSPSHQPRPFANIAHDPPVESLPEPLQSPDNVVTPDQLCLAAGIENCFDLLDLIPRSSSLVVYILALFAHVARLHVVRLCLYTGAVSASYTSVSM